MNSHAILVGIVICVVLLSCGSRGSGDKTATHPDSTGSQNLILYHEDTAIDSKAKVYSLRNLAKNLHLPVLSGGYQGLYMRIWAWDFGDNRYVVDIKKSPKGNECTMLAFLPTRKDTTSYLLINERRDLTPGSGWKNFFDSVEKYDIPGMARQHLSVEQRTRRTSMEYIQIEVDQPDRYQLLEYLDPFIFKDEDSASGKMYKFIRYFNKEMGTNIYAVE